MYLLFEEAGKFMTGRILSEADSSLQVELDSGKRVKVKQNNALLRFEQPQPSQLMARAQALASGLELELAYEFAPPDEFTFTELAQEYFSAQASTEQQVAALLCLQSAPHYFRRAGKGRYKKAPSEVLAQALLAIEKKQQVLAQIEAWAQALTEGQCPPEVRACLYHLLFKPDKNGPEYKAVVEAAKRSHQPPLRLLQNAGAIESAYQFHWQRFLFEHFPKGTGFGLHSLPQANEALPLAEVLAFSIDDSATTEIDDALSVQGLGSGTVTLGIHIAAPGLAIAPDSPLDQIARNRLSTVYMPGHKITMLPDELVQAYTLSAGQACPAVSLYLRYDEATLQRLDHQTRLERVPIAHNLRHDQLDAAITPEWLSGAVQDGAGLAASAALAPEVQALQPELAFLWRLAQHLKAGREAVRNKPENFNQPDYSFRLEGVVGNEPRGDERLVLGLRRRGAPLDLMVAEAMIVANSTWGQWLAECGVPGIYRSQASLAPGVKVRMGTKAQPHAGIGVPSYAWSTSPLRRYVDLVNQWQIVACVRHGTTAALAAPFKHKDAQLFAIVSAFDTTYSAYNQFQRGMERYWVLQYLRQNQVKTLEASVLKDNLVRADGLPLVLPVMGVTGLARGARVRVAIGVCDDMALEVCASLIERLDSNAEPMALEEGEDTVDGEGGEEALGGALQLAIDLDNGPDPSEQSEGEAAGAAPPGATSALFQTPSDAAGAPASDPPSA